MPGLRSIRPKKKKKKKKKKKPAILGRFAPAGPSPCLGGLDPA
jgi:hypothetical protein